MERGTQFFSDDYNDVIIEAVAHHNFESTNTLIANEVTVKGTKYRKNMIIVIDDDDQGLVSLLEKSKWFSFIRIQQYVFLTWVFTASH